MKTKAVEKEQIGRNCIADIAGELGTPALDQAVRAGGPVTSVSHALDTLRALALFARDEAKVNSDPTDWAMAERLAAVSAWLCLKEVSG